MNEAAENAEEVLPVVQPKTEFGKKEAAKGEAVPAEILPAAHPQPEPGKKEASKEKAVPAEMPKTMVTEEELKKAPVINDVSQCVLCGMCLRGCVGGALILTEKGARGPLTRQLACSAVSVWSIVLNNVFL